MFRLRASVPPTSAPGASLLGTPQANMKIRSDEFAKGRTPNALEFVRMYRTPNTMDGMEPKTQDALAHEMEHRPGRSEPNNLRDQVACREGLRLWPTPTTPSGHCTGRLDEWGGRQNPFRGTAEGGGQLNPDFVEWLMNFPKGWTEV